MQRKNLSMESVKDDDGLLPHPPLLTIDQALQQAIAHHRAGRLQEAERLYRAIILTQPTHCDANHNLGVLAAQVKQPAGGLSYLKAALEANPNQGQYWLSYIDVLIQASQLDLAQQVLTKGRQRGLQGVAIEALSKRLDAEQQAIEEKQEIPSFVAKTSEKIPKKKSSKAGKFVRKSCPPHEKSPSLSEINSLVALFNEGLYSKAETLAQSITERFPLHGFGWKVLGAVLQQTRRSDEALAAKQRAAALSPHDAEAHNNLGVTLQELGRFAEAEESYLRALQIKPDCAEAHSNMSTILRERGWLTEAEASCQRALSIKPDYAEALFTQGNIHKDLGRLEAAVASYQKVLQVKPEHGETHNNLGSTLYDLSRLDEAEVHFRQALRIKPDYAEAYSNLGHTLRDLDNPGQAAIAYQKTLEIDPANSGLDAAVYLAILLYLDGDFERCRNKLLVSQQVMTKSGIRHKNSRNYWRYLDALLTWHQQPTNRQYTQMKDAETLYVIGDSHSLTAHGVVVRYKEQVMRCAAELIVGCKQWHLGNDEANKYKHKFEAIMARLPRQSPLLLTIGEIDCRHDDGISKYLKKYPEKSLVNTVQSTIDAYIRYICKTSRQHGHQVVVGGVPRASKPIDSLTQEQAEQLVNLIRIFNQSLREKTLEAGLDFLDVYTLTNPGDGMATEEWHLDGCHLKPNALAEGFDMHLQGHVFVKGARNVAG